jgi:putative DNA primase/helicase
MIDLAGSESEVAIRLDELDTHPHLLNCPNGTLDLLTGELHPHRRDDLITQLCPTEYVPNASAPRWEAFVASIFAGNRELIDYVQCVLGSCLTGDVSDQCLFIFWGDGSNGKTTLLRVVCDVLGPDYAMEAKEGFLDAGRNTQHPTELTDLYRKRLVLVDEMDQDRGLNEGRIKRLTGGNSIRARKMGQNYWEFGATHKLIVCTNHKPRVQGRDHGWWRRVRLVPFTVRFWKPEDFRQGEQTPPAHLRADRTLPTALDSEKAGILAWLVRGCLDWRRRGLEAPAIVKEATDTYRDEQDLFGQFLAECVTRDVNAKEQGSLLLKAYRAWVCSLRGKPLSPPAFKAEMERAGFAYTRSTGATTSVCC